jgi:hypothetical protein
MVPAATLKVFEPLTAFEEPERAYWSHYVSENNVPPPDTLLLSREHGLRGQTAAVISENEHADTLERDGVLYVCPHRTKLRLLASVLAFRRTIPAEVVGAFMPDDEVERATNQIESLRNDHPGWHNHVLESTWEVPLHWFVPFVDEERSVQPTRRGRPSIRYETTMANGRERVQKALEIVRLTLPNPAVIAPLAGIARWIDEFATDGYVVLDYGDIGSLLSDGELHKDHTAGDIWSSIRALAEGEGDKAAAHYMVAAERWSGVRRRETWN